jgi:hypothetical protein
VSLSTSHGCGTLVTCGKCDQNRLNLAGREKSTIAFLNLNPEFEQISASIYESLPSSILFFLANAKLHSTSFKLGTLARRVERVVLVIE